MYVEANGIRLFYEKTGEGKPLIMVHGNSETHSIFDAAVEVLKKDFTVYAVDSRGHGQSERVSEFHYDDMAEDIRCFIKELNIEKPYYYGFSDGGIVGMIAAAKYTDIFSAMMISGPNTRPSAMKKKYLAVMKPIYFFTRSPLFKLMLTEPDITAETLLKIDMPVYITAGENDMIKQSDIDYIHAHIKDSSLKIFPGQSHSSYIAGSRLIAEYIKECFL